MVRLMGAETNDIGRTVGFQILSIMLLPLEAGLLVPGIQPDALSYKKASGGLSAAAGWVLITRPG